MTTWACQGGAAGAVRGPRGASPIARCSLGARPPEASDEAQRLAETVEGEGDPRDQARQCHGRWRAEGEQAEGLPQVPDRKIGLMTRARTSKRIA